jgi:hypothetical protein
MSLAIILDREFRHLEQAGSGPFPTVLSQATFLGMDKTYLSKLRNGATLSRPKASDMAAKLRKGAAAGKAAELIEEMLNAATADAPRATTQFEASLSTWFADRATTEAIMIVEFREPPVVAGRPDLAKVVGKAVAEGLYYAMLLPVNMNTVPQHPKAIRTYFETLEDYLVETYHGILEFALGEKAEELSKRNETNASKIKEELTGVQNRLRLYRLDEGGWSSCPALGVRLFYTEQQDKVPGNAPHAEQTVGQLWKWVSFADGGGDQREVTHQIRQKEAGPELMRATTMRFCPILDYWREKDSLPLSQADLVAFVSEHVVDPKTYGAVDGTALANRWKIEPPPELLLKKALKNYNNRTTK